MVIAVTHLATAGNNTDGTSFSSASITPAANRLIVACYHAMRTDDIEPTQPTVTGNGLTWSLQRHLYYNSSTAANDDCIFVFAADTGASPSTGAVTFDHGATTHQGALWSIFDIDGTDLTSSGGASTVAQCFVQFVDSTPNTVGTSEAITLAAAGNSNNRPFLIAVHLATEVTTPRAGWTEINDASIGLPSGAIETQWRSDTFETSTSATWVSTVRKGGIAFEIRALVSGAPIVARRMLLGVGT